MQTTTTTSTSLQQLNTQLNTIALPFTDNDHDDDLLPLRVRFTREIQDTHPITNQPRTTRLTVNGPLPNIKDRSYRNFAAKRQNYLTKINLTALTAMRAAQTESHKAATAIARNARRQARREIAEAKRLYKRVTSFLTDNYLPTELGNITDSDVATDDDN